MTNPDEPAVVYSGTYSEAGLMQGLLEEQGISAYLQDEFLGSLAPWYIGPGGAGAVKVVVAGRDAEAAREVVAIFLSEENGPQAEA